MYNKKVPLPPIEFMNKTSLSKFLSYVLRHRPDSIGLEMSKAGWVNIAELLEKSKNGLTREVLDEIVQEDGKQRYAVSEDGLQIRANQGHSVEVDLGLKAAIPPVTLYHGTPESEVAIIMKTGLKKMRRHHVHLSADFETALKVGKRRTGKALVLSVDTRNMVKQGIKFFISENGVWLTDFVAPEFLSVSMV